MIQQVYEQIQSLALNQGTPRFVQLTFDEYGNGWLTTSDKKVRIYFESMESLVCQLAQYKETVKI